MDKLLSILEEEKKQLEELLGRLNAEIGKLEKNMKSKCIGADLEPIVFCGCPKCKDKGENNEI